MLQARLPSEAEWEYIARAGDTTIYPCGDDPACLDDIAWYRENADSKSHPAARKEMNSLGIFDLWGNVWEWTADCWSEDYQNAPSDGGAWDEEGCERRVIRGGGWNFGVWALRNSARTWYEEHGAASYIGFRCARSLGKSE